MIPLLDAALRGSRDRTLPAALLAALMATGSCRRASDGEEVHHLRARGKIQHDLGTAEGYRAAADLFEEVTRRRPGDRDDLVNHARCLVFTDEAARAREVLAEVRRGFPGEVPTAVLYLEGLAAKRSGDLKTAADRFREVAGRDPGCVPAWYQLGEAQSGLKDFEGAIDAYRKVSERDRGYFASAALNSIHLLHRRAGRQEEADRWMERFKALHIEHEKTLPPGNPPHEFYELSRYTRVNLVPTRRAEVEPREATLPWEDIAGQLSLPPDSRTGVRAVAAFDFDGDGDLDLFLCRDGPNLLLRNDGLRSDGRSTTSPPGFTDLTELSNAGDAAVDALAADFSNDGLIDLYLRKIEGPGVLLLGLGEGVFQPSPPAFDLEGRILSARWVDFDHDGDLDLVHLSVSPEGTPRGGIVRNNGDRTFTDLTGASGGELLPGTLGPAGPVDGARFDAADLDLGNDIDLIFPGFDGDAVAYLNRREGPFRRAPITGTRGSRIVLAGDLDEDGDPDILLPPAEGAPLRIAWNEDPAAAGGPRFSVEEPPAAAGLPAARDALLCDLDNDGDLDLVLATREGPRILLDRRGGKLAPLPPGPEPFWRASARRVAAADLEGRGRLDLLVVTEAGELAVLRAKASPEYPAAVLRLIGTRDNRDGIGALVEVFAGKVYQARMVDAPGGARLGLGTVPLGETAGSAGIDGLRITWPNGIVQAVPPRELRWDERRRVDIVQKSGLNVSCPFLFAWDGREMRFLTDVVGIAPLDEWVPGGGSPRLVAEEHVRIPGDRLAPKDGRLVLAITEELRETTYLDLAELIEVVGPAGRELFLDESTRRGAPSPLEVLAVERKRLEPPLSVRGPDGLDRLEEVLAADGRYLHSYRSGRTQWAGWVEPARLEIDLPQGLGPSTLLLTGRIAWPDSDAVFSVSQSGRGWRPPSLETLGAGPGGERSWRTLFEDIGFPNGMDRTLALPLPAGAERLRISTNHRFLWDRISIARGGIPVDLSSEGIRTVMLPEGEAKFSRRTIPLARADLSYHGRSGVRGDPERHEETYDYAAAEPASDFRRAKGLATRYGEVGELLSRTDDRLAVMVAGDGLLLAFKAPPPLPESLWPAGSARTWFLRLAGWAKEGSFHNRTGRWIAPLPYGAMGSYPPPEPRPRDRAYREYLESFQTRWIE